MEVKDIPFECKADMDQRTFEGYASTFGNVDQMKDIMEKGAFARTLAEDYPAGRIKVLWQHSDPLGVPLHMEEDSTGLYVRGRVSQTQFGDDALTYMRDGVVDRMSIGFRMRDSEDDEEGVRHIKDVKLYEFSPVLFPANEEAGITGVKFMLDAVETAKGRKELETMLRAAGFSRQAATVFVAKARDIGVEPGQPESQDDEIAEIVKQLEQVTDFARHRLY